jgi:hypothetical protein
MHVLRGSLTTLLVAELWERSGRRSLTRVGEIQSPDWSDKEMIATWRLDLNRILDVFNVDHLSEPRCLYQFSWLFQLVGNVLGCRWLLIYALKHSQERGDDF